jgi:hypothetical protein
MLFGPWVCVEGNKLAYTIYFGLDLGLGSEWLSITKKKWLDQTGCHFIFTIYRLCKF